MWQGHTAHKGQRQDPNPGHLTHEPVLPTSGTNAFQERVWKKWSLALLTVEMNTYFTDVYVFEDSAICESNESSSR